MALRGGPLPMPAEEHIRRGNPSHYRQESLKQAMALRGVVGDMTPPRWLMDKPAAARIWFQQAPDLWGRGLLTETDKTEFAIYCEALADYIRLGEEIKKEGEIIVYTNKFGAENEIPNPKVKLRRDRLKTLLDIGRHFGMNPASATQIGRMIEPPKRKQVESKPSTPEDMQADFQQALLGELAG